MKCSVQLVFEIAVGASTLIAVGWWKKVLDDIQGGYLKCGDKRNPIFKEMKPFHDEDFHEL